MDGDESDRVIAIWGLSKFDDEAMQADIEKRAVDGTDREKLAVALARLSNRQRSSAALLVQLLNSEDKDVRLKADFALRRLSGKWLGFVGSNKAEDRAAAIEEWTLWLTDEFPMRDVRFFVPVHLTDRHRLRDCELRSSYQAGGPGVEIRNQSGKVVWRLKGYVAYDAEVMANGNLLASTKVNSKVCVAEFDRNDRLVWQHGTTNIYKSHELPDGNVLVANYKSKKALVVDRKSGKVTRTIDTDGERCDDVIPLPENEFLIATEKRVLRVGKDGEKKVLLDEGASGLTLLDDGRVVVSQWITNKFRMMTLDGETLWERPMSQVSDVTVAENGNYLVASGNKTVGFLELDKDFKVVKETKGYSGRTFQR